MVRCAGGKLWLAVLVVVIWTVVVWSESGLAGARYPHLRIEIWGTPDLLWFGVLMDVIGTWWCGVKAVSLALDTHISKSRYGAPRFVVDCGVDGCDRDVVGLWE
ncbi:MAG: hypothetical protein M3Y50_11585 [Acidobacteriota bacterium]|nr:hypothetical protein [Acidobacteriota bacterium]